MLVGSLSVMGRKRNIGRLRRLPADDPQSLDHPGNREKILELARALGMAMADRDFDQAASRHLPKEITPKDV